MQQPDPDQPDAEVFWANARTKPDHSPHLDPDHFQLHRLLHPIPISTHVLWRGHCLKFSSMTVYMNIQFYEN